MRSRKFLPAKCVTLEKIMQIDLNMSPFQYFKVLATNVTPLNPFLET